ncbi:DUF4956 domain-containing protein [Aureliella helgolandensis]|uniref:DUF4956 domain-containing protein n=1 Tax=Aureliella helgolandensis TaxID=2527968 RepID=A0A518G7N0_9BACT|nr:DUF4956 domain-containing protein [Aureliella helgolandensis]QDV24596.1 hypothetical protein Q31a_29160 [Aureliella helgolandensis]
MPEWLTVEVSATNVSLPTLVLRLTLAWLGGLIVAAIAVRHRESRTDATLSLTLVLMSILIAMATQIIGDNVARAFSLVGALSIVRFRTAVSTTRDVAFVLAAVVVGMAIGAGQYTVAALGLLIVGCATLIPMGARIREGAAQASSSPSKQGRGGSGAASPAPGEMELRLQVGLHGDQNWTEELQRRTSYCELIAAETTRKGSALEFLYRVRLLENSDAGQLVAALNCLPLVESVALKV